MEEQLNALNRHDAAKYLGLKYRTLKKRTDLYPSSFRDGLGRHWYYIDHLDRLQRHRERRRLRNDLTGKEYGRLLVLCPLPTQKGKNTRYLCLCDCGCTCAVIGSELVRSRTGSCGCLAKDIVSERSVVDVAGIRFGRLIVLERHGRQGSQATWSCLCDCGNTTVVTGGNLRTKNTRSCGCYQKDLAADHAKILNAKYELPDLDVSVDDLLGRLDYLFL